MGIASISIALIFSLPWLWQLKLEHDLRSIEDSIQPYSEVSNILQEFDRLNTDIAIMENFLRDIEDKSKNPRLVMEQVEKLLPEGTTLTLFSLQTDKSLQLELVLPGPPEVARLWVNLRDSGMFEDFYMETVSLVDQPQSINLTLKLK